jgi:hypothetical protein|tara:strand:- start:1820 stop:1987 length:168 start_codon:yes stop_codon:yes gene_type:complete
MAKSKGLGDSIAKATKITGIKSIVDAASKIMDKPCGCNKRQNKLNELFPYNNGAK